MSNHAVAHLEDIEEVTDGREPWRPVRHHFGIGSFGVTAWTGKQRGHLFLVADGMGAHAVGEKASEQAAHIIPHIYQKHAQQGPPQALRQPA